MFDTQGSGGPGPSPPGLGEPVWRKNPPTEPGLYWFKLRINDEYPPPGVLRFCQVIHGGDGSLILGCRNFDSDHFQRVEGLQRWWAGPLLEPPDG